MAVAQPARQRAAPATLAVASVAGAALALYNYLAPLTGVTGTLGALVVIATVVILALLGVLLFVKRSGGAGLTFRILGLIIALGTLAAAWLLHEFWLVLLMAIAVLAVLVDFAAPKGGAQS